MAYADPLTDQQLVAADVAALKVAIVHPFLIEQGGGEKVIDALAGMFPRAEFFTLLSSPQKLSPELAGRRIHTSFLNRLPFAHRFYQHLSPLYDLATSLHDLRGFDLAISSGGPGAKTVVLGPDTLHLHYCHSPVRFLWDQFPQWVQRMPPWLRPVFAASALNQRERDFNAAQRVDAFIANSDFIGRRLARYYRRASVTIYPPVDLAGDSVDGQRGDYYLTVGRLVPGKRTDLLIKACSKLGRKLIVVGRGPEEARLRRLAGPGVTLAGRVDDLQLDQLYRHARAFLFAAEEDFGIAMVEAQSYGLPSIALAKGGALEIMTPYAADRGGNAIMFDEQTTAAVVDAIERFEAVEDDFDAATISAAAQRFSKARFVADLNSYVATELTQRSFMLNPAQPTLSLADEPAVLPRPNIVFGMRISEMTGAAISAELAAPLRLPDTSPRMFAAPNIGHVSLMRGDAELRSAMAAADIVTCDGFPVVTYAKLRGCRVPGRITGREVADHLMNQTELASSHRLFFLVDGPETANAVSRWAAKRASNERVQVEIAPAGFDRDEAYCGQLADMIVQFETTLLFLCIETPRSELFFARFRDRLPACWALCIGRSVRIALGLTMPPPRLAVRLNLEWLWLMAKEPRRLFRWYVAGTIGFTLAVAKDYVGRSR